MNYCSGFNVNGLPCLNKTKGCFCKIHRKHTEECGVCYEPMVQTHIFECGHNICLSCMAGITASSQEFPLIKCPFCRNISMQHIESYFVTILNVHSIIEHLQEETKKVKVNEMLCYLFSHIWIFRSIVNIQEVLLDLFSKKHELIEPKYFKIMKKVFKIS